MKKILFLLLLFIPYIGFSQTRASIDTLKVSYLKALKPALKKIYVNDTLVLKDGNKQISAFTETIKNSIPNKLDRSNAAFDTTVSAPAYKKGQLYWDDTNKTLSLQTGLGGSTQQIGEELYILAQNNTGAPILNGKLVYIYDAGGSVARIRLADNTYGNNTYKMIGMATSDIAHGGQGFVTTYGNVNGINTNGMTEGLPVYLTSNGGYTQTKPTNHIIRVGYVVYAHSTNGIILVCPHKETSEYTAVLNNNATFKASTDTVKGFAVNGRSLHLRADTMQSQIDGKQNALTLTTSGTSGAATLIGSTLNIPQYSGGGGGVPTDRTLTINGNAQDLSANRTWNVSAIITDSVMGTLYNSNSWASTSDFSAAGSVTHSASGGKINISGGSYNFSSTQGTNNGSIANALRISKYGNTGLEKWKMTVKFKVNAAPSGSSYGLAIGTWSENSWARSHALGFINLSTNTYKGKTSLILGSNSTTADTSSYSLAFSQNDYILLTVERNENNISCFAKNITTGIGNSANIYQYDQTNASGIITPNTGQFAIIPCGGTYIIDSISIVSTEIRKPDILLVGDSKTTGYSTSFGRRISSVLKSLTGLKIAVNAGPTDLSTNLLNKFHEIKAYQPKQIVMCIGRNDGAIANDTITMKVSIQKIVDSCATYNIPLKIIDGIYETAYDQTKIMNWLRLTYGSKVLRVYDGGKKSSYLSSDLVHPSYLGAYYVANAINNVLKDSTIYFEKKTTPEQNFEYNNLNFYGNIKGYSSNTVYPTASLIQKGDIVLGYGNRISAAYNLAAQNCWITICEGSTTTFNANYLNGGFVWNNAPATTGTLVEAMRLTPGGTTGSILKLNGSYNGANRSVGDVETGYNGAFAGVGAPQSGYQGRFVPFATGGHTEIRNYKNNGTIDFYTSGGVDGSQLLALSMAANAKLSTDSIFTAKNGLSITEGTNKKMGVATLSSGTVTVNNTKVTANTRIMLTIQSPSGTVGTPYISDRTANTSFTISSTSGSDASVVAWVLIEP